MWQSYYKQIIYQQNFVNLYLIYSLGKQLRLLWKESAYYMLHQK